MRLDKFLKIARIIKRRTIAKEAAILKRVLVNQKIAKPSTLLNLNDLLTIYLGQKTLIIKVISLLPKKDELMYELISEEKINNDFYKDASL